MFYNPSKVSILAFIDGVDNICHLQLNFGILCIIPYSNYDSVIYVYGYNII